MNSFSKYFIEDNINLIETAQWYKLFCRWYNRAVSDIREDELNLREFFRILEAAGIPALEETESIRKQLIKEKIIELATKILATEESVGMVSCLNPLKSRMLFGLITLKNLFSECCEELGLVPTSSIKSLYKKP